MSPEPLSPRKLHIVIAGGGTAGWCAAAALSQQLMPLADITLVESDTLGTIGVGEASIPPMKAFHRLAGVDEQAFMRATHATFKIGIQFEHWTRPGDSYIHSFGRLGKSAWMADFHHVWLHAKALGLDVKLDDYCLELKAALNGKFVLSDAMPLNYAYHLDATAYARFLRDLCAQRGVKRIEGLIEQVQQHADSGHITHLVLENGQAIAGDFFIDCTGFRALLIGNTLKVAYEDWSRWLPANRAVAIQSELNTPPMPYTRSIAREAGWQWHIPLQHRAGNGLVYCSDYLSDEAAQDRLLHHLPGKPTSALRRIPFQTGYRTEQWNKNCLSLGLSSGFLEPLESTSIYLMMIGITRFIKQFPFDGIAQATIDQFNTVSREEFEHIRDFIFLHYYLNERQDSPYWADYRRRPVPESLQHRMDLFRTTGLAFPPSGDLFTVDSWVQVTLGQHLWPTSYHPIGRMVSDEHLIQSLNNYKNTITRQVDEMPHHAEFIAHYCAANEQPM